MQRILKFICMFLGLAIAVQAKPVAATSDGPPEMKTPPIVWRTDFEKALTLAGMEYRPVLVLFSSPGCAWCKRLKDGPLQDPEVTKLLRNFIPVLIDVTEDRQTAAYYGVQSVPRVTILNSRGSIVVQASGFLPVRDLQRLMMRALNPKLAIETDAVVDELVQLIKSGKVPDDRWHEIMIALGKRSSRETLRKRIFAMKKLPLKVFVSLLDDSRVAVRLGALEILEEVAGSDFGFDPWLTDATTGNNKEAIAKFKAFIEGKDDAKREVFLAFDKEQLAYYIRDLISGNRYRSTRAMRMLLQGGAGTIKGLREYVKANPELTSSARRQVRELQYAIYLSSSGTANAEIVAHRLIFGNLDARLRTMRDLARLGKKTVPVLKDFLNDEDPLVRETCVEALAGAGTRNQVVPLFQKHVQTEKNKEVLYVILKSLAKFRSKRGLAILMRYLKNPDEDLVIAALGSIAKLKTDLAAEHIGRSLEDKRWRVRVAALTAVGELRIKTLEGKVLKMIDDTDDFVRYTAVKTLPRISKTKAAKALELAFAKDDKLKPSIVAAFGSMDMPLPKSFSKALKGKDGEVILSVIHAMKSCDVADLKIIAGYVKDQNLDLACTTASLLASKGMKDSKYRGIITEIIQGENKKLQLAVLRDIRLPDPSDGRVDDLMMGDDDDDDGEAGSILDAFFGDDDDGKPKAKKPKKDVAEDIMADFGLDGDDEATEGGDAVVVTAGKATSKQIVAAVEKLMERTNDPEVKFAAARIVSKQGSSKALDYFLEILPQASVEERLRICYALRPNASKKAVELAIGLLRDKSDKVRREISEVCLRDTKGKCRMFKALFEELLRDGTPLRPIEIYSYNVDDAMEAAGGTAAEYVKKLLEPSRSVRLQTLGLILASDCKGSMDAKLVTPYLKATNLYLRRAAAYACFCLDKTEFAKHLKAIGTDASDLVRETVPTVYAKSSSSSFTRWVHYFDKNTFKRHSSYDYSSSDNRQTLPDEAREVLKMMCDDSSQRVRVRAHFALLANRVPIDLKKLIVVLDQVPDQQAAATMVGEFFEQHYRMLGPDFKVLLPYLSRAKDFSSWTMKEIRKKFPDTEADEDISLDLEIVDRPKTKRKKIMATFRPQEAVTDTGSMPELRVIYFSSPGCNDCKRAEKMMPELKKLFPKLKLEKHDITKIDAMRLNEMLCDRFEVSEKVRLIAPAFFAAGGYLIKTDVTYPALAQLVARSSAIRDTKWCAIEKGELEKAEIKIGKRFSVFSIGAVALAGLLDGINPCAFATIIFLLSYLKITRRKPRETAQIGIAFIVGVFVAYFSLGLGMMEIVTRFKLLAYLGKIVNIGVAAFAVVIMVLSIRDGVLCVQGRMADMSLQLPTFLKKGIHTTIRRGSRHAHFVLAAFIVGVIISFLELACTGQVYLPTILFMLKTGQAQSRALTHLSIYNLAFIAPLILIFGMACHGLTNDGLRRFMERHAALVKFATAALFLALALFMIFGNQILARLNALPMG